jgi:PKD repeat protein
LTSAISSPTNTVETGEPASFKCTAGGGVPPYTYSWAFGDGATGVGATLSHIYGTPGVVALSCTVTDTLGTTAKASTDLTVGSDPSITAFTASPTSLFPDDKLTFDVSVSGGYGTLSYSYANLPPGCLSTNSTSLTCYPTSSGNYRVTVTVTDRAMESANATTIITVGPQRVLGLPQAMGLAVIFAAIVGTSAVLIMSVALALRRKKRRQAPGTA